MPVEVTAAVVCVGVVPVAEVADAVVAGVVAVDEEAPEMLELMNVFRCS
jgi:hypothetical protein